MHQYIKQIAGCIALSLGFISPAFAGAVLGIPLSIDSGGLVGLVAAGVVGAVWLAKRKR